MSDKQSPDPTGAAPQGVEQNQEGPQGVSVDRNKDAVSPNGERPKVNLSKEPSAAMQKEADGPDIHPVFAGVEQNHSPDMENNEPDNEPEARETPDASPSSDAAASVNPGMWGNIFNGCVKGGPIFLFVILCLVAWPNFWHPEQGLFCPAEQKYISAFLNCISNASWLTPMALADGGWTLPQWPLFYWFTGLLSVIPGVVEGNFLLPLAGVISAALALWGVWFATHTTGFGLKGALAAGIILICSPLFAPLPHFVGPVVLAAALMLFAIGFFHRGWKSEYSWLSLPAAFILTALAGMCGGTFFFAIPLIASFFFLIWQGKFSRAQKMDALLGFILMLILIGLWLGTIMLGDYPASYLRALFSDSLNFTEPFSIAWWLPMAIAAAGLMPWLLMILCVSWFRVLRKSVSSLAASRRENGSAMLWLSLVLACCLSLFIPQKQFAAIAILCLTAPLLGKAFVKLSPIGNRVFFLLASLALICAGLVIVVGSLEFSQGWLFALLHFTPDAAIKKMLLASTAFPIIGGICIAGGLFGFFFAKRCRQGGGLIYASLLLVILTQPALLMVVPDLAPLQESRLETFQTIKNKVDKALADTTAAAPAMESVAPAPVPTENAEPGQADNSREPAAQQPVEQNTPTDTPAAAPELSSPAEQNTPVAPEEPAAPAAPEAKISAEPAPDQPEPAQNAPETGAPTRDEAKDAQPPANG